MVHFIVVFLLHTKFCYNVFSAAVDHGPPSHQLSRNNIIDVTFVTIVIIVIVKASIFSAEEFISNKQTLTEQDCNLFLILPAGGHAAKKKNVFSGVRYALEERGK